MSRRSIACFVGAVLLASMPVARIVAQSAAVPTLVILVRHAEKATAPADDPAISEAGQARAKALGDALANANVSAIITSPRRRTIETAGVVARARGLTAEPIALEGPANAHINAVAQAVRKHPGEVVLVVGHSNTIPAIVTALGGPKLPEICDGVYSTMFVMEIGARSEPRVVTSQYGAADPVGADQCHVQKPE